MGFLTVNEITERIFHSLTLGLVFEKLKKLSPDTATYLISEVTDPDSTQFSPSL